MAPTNLAKLLAVPLLFNSLTGQAQTAPPETTGFAIEYQGVQSHDSSLPMVGDWAAQRKYNERGLALRWEFANHWFVEGRGSRGSHLRYLLATEEDADGDLQYDENEGTTTAYSAGVGKRLPINRYFSVLPSVSYFYREIRTPELYSDFDSRRFAASKTREHSVGAGIKAEYRVIERWSVSLNFTLLSSGERQQGLGIAYYFN